MVNHFSSFLFFQFSYERVPRGKSGWLVDFFFVFLFSFFLMVILFHGHMGDDHLFYV